MDKLKLPFVIFGKYTQENLNWMIYTPCPEKRDDTFLCITLTKQIQTQLRNFWHEPSRELILL